MVAGQTISVGSYASTFSSADAHQWLADGTAILGATASTYFVTPLEEGKTISLKINAVETSNTLDNFYPLDASITRWYDANFGVTLDSSNKVTTWADRTGSSNDLAQTSAADRPSKTAEGIVFAGLVATECLVATSMGNTALSLVAMLNNNLDSATDQNKTWIANINDTDEPNWALRARQGQYLTTGIDQITQLAIPNNEFGSIALRTGSIGLKAASKSVNGTLETKGIPTLELANTPGSKLVVGRQKPGNAARHFKGTIQDIILSDNGNLSDDELQKIEWYLHIKKFGNTNKLPSTHPYKNNIPN